MESNRLVFFLRIVVIYCAFPMCSRGANNLFNGTLPEEWGTAAAFPELTTLDLSNNQLSGTLPALWSNPRTAQYMQEL